MSFPAIFFVLGWLLTFFGIAMLLPGFVDIILKGHDVSAFLVSGFSSIFAGITMVIMNNDKDKQLSHKDAFLLTFLTWVSLSFVGALPLYFSGAASNFIDAFFEAVSGLTTTGASVLSDLDNMDKGILLWRAILQWLGGMGVIVLATAIIPFLGVGGMQLYKAEMPGVIKDKLQPRLKETAKLLWLVYLVLTITCVFAYIFAGMTTFDAICHAFTTVATGGFSTHDASMGYFNSPMIEWICIFFMLVGAVNFTLHYLVFSGNGFKVYWENSEFRAFFILVIGAVLLSTIVLTASEYYYGWEESFRYSLFNIVAVVTTTGYASTDYAAWPVFIPMLIMLLMFIGGSSGSTAGGMKVMRIIMIIKQGFREVFRLIHPRGVVHVKISGVRVPSAVTQAVWAFAGLYITSFVVISVILASYGLDQITAFSAAAATLTGLGPGLGDVGPASNYAMLEPSAKLLLCLSMLLGRLELFTLLVIITPAFWRK